MFPFTIDIDPNTNGLPGISQLKEVVGAMMTIGLICAVLGLIISAIIWALGANSSNPQMAGRGKTGVLIALVAAALTGGAVALANFAHQVGQQV